MDLHTCDGATVLLSLYTRDRLIGSCEHIDTFCYGITSLHNAFYEETNSSVYLYYSYDPKRVKHKKGEAIRRKH